VTPITDGGLDVRVYGNLFANNLTTTANVEATYLKGDGSEITHVTLDQVVNYGNVTSNTIQLTNADVGLKATGNVEANYFVGNGSKLTGLVTDLQSVTDNGNTTSNTIQFTNATTALIADSNVGIGTSTPSANLHVVGHQYVNDPPTLANSFDHSDAPLTLTHGTPTSTTAIDDPKAVLHLTRDGTSGESYGARASFNLSRYENSSTHSRSRLDLALADGTYAESTVMTLRSDGKVGVGTSVPAYKLDVDGDINLSGDFYQGGSPFVSSLWTDGTDSLYYRSNVEVGTANLFVDTTTGNVGIGTDAPTHTLDVHGTANVGALTATSVSGNGSALFGIQSSNVSDFASNVTRITTLETDLGSNATRIGTLETDLGSNATRIGTLETDLGSNATRIGTLESGDHTFTGIKTFENDVILESNLRVQGDLLVANTVNLTVSDPIIELGSNNSGTNDLGIIMTRPNNNSNVAVVFDESVDILRMGYTLNGANDTVVDLDSNALAVSIQGALSAASVSGDGSGLTNLNASNVSSGTINAARIPNLDADKITTGTLTRPISTTTGTFSGDVEVTGELTTKSNVFLGVMHSHGREGTLEFGRADGTDRVHNIKVYNSSTQTDNYMKFQIHAGGASVGTVTDNVLYLRGDGNVGIGTASPTYNLDVGGRISAFNNGTHTPGIMFKSGTSNTNEWMVRANVSDTYAGELTIGRSDTTSPSFFTIDNSGNVGIGTGSPARPLTIESSSFDGIRVKRTIAGGGSAIELINGNDDEWTVGVGGTGTFGIYDGATFGEQFTIDTSGNVGIGTTNPSHPLTIQETTTNTNTVTYPLAIRAISSGTVANGFGAGIRFQCERMDTDNYQSLAGSVEVYGAGNLPGASDLWNMRFGVRNNDTAVTPMTLRYDGNVGIGTTDADYKLHIRSGTATALLLESDNGGTGYPVNIDFRNYDAQDPPGARISVIDDADYGSDITFNTKTGSPGTGSLSQRMIIQGDGNVGIGTASPGEKLEVSGSIKRSGATYTKAYTYSSVTANDNLYIGRFSIYAPPAKIDIRDSGTALGSGSRFSLARYYNKTPRVQGFENSYYTTYKFYYQAVNTSIYDVWFRPSRNGNYVIHVDATEFTDTTEPSSPTLTECDYGLFTADGKVGIGTASPGYPLDVSFAGDSGMALRSTTSHTSLNFFPNSGYSYLRFHEANGSTSVWLQAIAGGHLAIRPQGGSETVRFNANGNVGIGNTNPAFPLTIGANDGNKIQFNQSGTPGHNITCSSGWQWNFNAARASQDDNAKITFNISGSSGYDEMMRVTHTGVGIGTANPSSRLDVDGNVRGNWFIANNPSSGDGDDYAIGSLENDYSAWINIFNNGWISGQNGWGTFWAGNSGARYRRVSSDSNPNEYVFVGGGSKRCTFDLDNGHTYLDGTLSNNSYDYAEYFEWEDGNPENEDRRGYSVVLASDGKIRKATSDDSPENIIGAVSGTSSITGDAAMYDWNGKYEVDEWGTRIKDKVYQLTWEVELENGEKQNHSYDEDRVPEGIIVPENASRRLRSRERINPEYDETRIYEPRDKRKEWSAIGLLGKVRVRDESPKHPNWKYLKTIAGKKLWLIK
jgi:plastocyanin